jgi:hypothetical protein
MFPPAPAVNDAHTEGAQPYWWSGVAWTRGHPPGPANLGDKGGHIGEILAWYNTTIPVTFLLCDGSAFDPLVYPDLAGFLGGASVPNMNNYVNMGVNNAGLGSRLPAALAAPRIPLMAHFTTTIGKPKGTSVNPMGDHRHVTFPAAQIVGWTGSSDHAYQTDMSEANHDYGMTYSSYEGAHHHGFTPVHAPIVHPGSTEPQPWGFTALPIIRALLP